jgi:hypothetical protein
VTDTICPDTHLQPHLPALYDNSNIIVYISNGFELLAAATNDKGLDQQQIASAQASAGARFGAMAQRTGNNMNACIMFETAKIAYGSDSAALDSNLTAWQLLGKSVECQWC